MNSVHTKVFSTGMLSHSHWKLAQEVGTTEFQLVVVSGATLVAPLNLAATKATELEVSY